ncbi:MAG TPA: hypothetical protein VIM10_00275 [Actinopolymorphaceae bacterium]|jgi:hypothetical protein
MPDLPDDLPPPRPFPDASRDAVKTMLINEVRASRRRRRQRPLVAGLATALVGTAIAAGSYVAFRQPTELRYAQCYSSVTADTDYRTTLAIGKAHRADDETPSPVEVTDAIGSCGNLWSQGILRKDVPMSAEPTPAPGSAPVPPLVACTLPDGTVGVYPGDESTCRTLGLPSTSRG